MLCGIQDKVAREVKECLVKELMERGYIESVARRFANEYGKKD
jgi:hypothetical protein